MRSAQEIITNTLRHAAARNLWLALRAEDGGVRLDSRDDGEGTDQLRLGHGLKGLRERFQQQGGQIAFESTRGSGFRVMGWIPTPLRARDPRLSRRRSDAGSQRHQKPSLASA
jgi:signal transduction histidine kinase